MDIEDQNQSLNVCIGSTFLLNHLPSHPPHTGTLFMAPWTWVSIPRWAIPMQSVSMPCGDSTVMPISHSSSYSPWGLCHSHCICLSCWQTVHCHHVSCSDLRADHSTSGSTSGSTPGDWVGTLSVGFSSGISDSLLCLPIWKSTVVPKHNGTCSSYENPPLRTSYLIYNIVRHLVPELLQIHKDEAVLFPWCVFFNKASRSLKPRH